MTVSGHPVSLSAFATSAFSFPAVVILRRTRGRSAKSSNSFHIVEARAHTRKPPASEESESYA